MVGYHILPNAISIKHEMEEGVVGVITDHAAGLLNVIRDAYNEEFYRLIDFTEESIDPLDEILDDWLDNNELSEDGKINLIKGFGGYLSVLIQKTFTGRWWHDGEQAVFILNDGDQQLLTGLTPYSYVVRRIESGESLSEQWEDQSPLVSHSKKIQISEDKILTKLQKNFGSDISVTPVFRDEERGVYFAYINKIDKNVCSFVHFHDVEKDNGTTYFLGNDKNYSLDIKPIEKADLRQAVGSDLYFTIMILIWE
jgi:hypothetical protein